MNFTSSTPESCLEEILFALQIISDSFQLYFNLNYVCDQVPLILVV